MNWISVKEHLPPINTDVLVIVNEPQKKHIPYDSRMKVCHRYFHLMKDEKGNFVEDQNSFAWNTLDTVTHWRELPEQPIG